MTSRPQPAAMLAGMTLRSGWRVVRRLEDYPGKTGGCFSCPYLVEKDGREAFLKALDYSEAEEMARRSGVDIPSALQTLLEAYNFERNLLKECAQKRMDRVVAALEDGSVRVGDEGYGILGTVNYLIFESADGDIRRHLALAANVEVAWKLRCLHHIATGLYQLHSAGVAHQDVKPSNVLVFGAKKSKIADLGSASKRGLISPRDDLEFAGESTYAPPELLYSYRDPEWNRRRQACDVYHLGSMAVFFFCGVGMTAMILKHLAPEHRPHNWGGTYREVLAEVRDAFGLTLREFEQGLEGPVLRVALRKAVGELCDPDPLQRGHPLNRAGAASRYSLELRCPVRYVGAEGANRNLGSELTCFWSRGTGGLYHAGVTIMPPCH
jgi:serine/threonine protein kinase